MTEAQRIEDYGQLVYEEQAEREHYEQIESIVDEKLKRLRNLRGKYVITTIGRDSGELVYLQNRRLSNARWWTYYLDSAVGFNTEEVGKHYLKRYKHNSPRLVQVTDEMVEKACGEVSNLMYA